MKIKVNGIQKTIPERWEEVTFEQFVKLAEPGADQTKVLSCLFDMPESEIKGAKIQGFENVISHIRFLQKPLEIDKKPKKLGEYEFPQKIEFETVEQYQDCLAEIQRVAVMAPDKQLESIPLYAAIYITSPYDSEKAKYKAEELKKLPCTEVMAAGAFFMTKSLSLQSGLPVSYLQRNLPMRKEWLGMRIFLSRSGFTRLWIVLRAMWGKMMKWFLNGR